MKCHQTRSLEKNRQTARELLLTKLDNLMNGEMSVESQKEKILRKKSNEVKEKNKKLRDLKKQWKEREESWQT